MQRQGAGKGGSCGLCCAEEMANHSGFSETQWPAIFLLKAQLLYLRALTHEASTHPSVCTALPMGDFSYGHTLGAQLRQRVGMTQLCRKIDGPGQKSGILASNFLDLSAEDRSLNCWGRKLALTRGTQSKNEDNPK